MQLEQWLARERIVVKTPAARISDVVTAAAGALAPATGLDEPAITAAVTACLDEGGYAIGNGVAVPHAEIEGLRAATAALVITAEPIDIGALDGEPVDLFFVIVAQPDDPRGHLRLLADVAMLAQSRLVRAALRRATSADEAWDLLEAAALRTAVAPATSRGSEPRHCLAMITVNGAQVVDALLMKLIAHGFQSASVLEAQTLEDAAASEVPLFAGFREIFGDPGGRRVFFFEMELERTDWLIEVVRQLCEERRAGAASVALMPLDLRWRWEPAPAPAEEPAGH